MRLQLDSSSAGADPTKSAEIGQTAATGVSSPDSRRVGSGLFGGQDSIQISGAASALNRLSTDRAARVQQLASSVQSGSYNVSSSLLAGAMVEHATLPDVQAAT